MLGSAGTHCALFGGSRSGKTALIFRAIATRALGAPDTRHGIFRYRFNHIKTSIILDTMPKVLELCWPGLLDRSHLDKSDYFLRFPNKSEIWFAGLDDKARTEKVLGMEFATVHLNECSQIPWASRNIAMTRLAQKSALRLKAYYDFNPPSSAHWTHKLFIEKIDPDRKRALPDPHNYVSILMNPEDNKANLSPEYLNILEGLPQRQRQRFLMGMFGDASEGALWTPELCDQQRILTNDDPGKSEVPDMQRIIIAVDPSGCKGEEDVRSDEIGIVVAGLGADGRGYVLEDLTGRHSADQWPQVVKSAFDRWGADRVVGEANYGGDMVRAVIQAARPGTPYKPVTASRGKILRAEPIAALFELQKVSFVGYFNDLEDELCSMTMSGYIGSRSPNRADAMVFALTELFPVVSRAKEPGSIHDREPVVVMCNPNRRH